MSNDLQGGGGEMRIPGILLSEERYERMRRVIDAAKAMRDWYWSSPRQIIDSEHVLYGCAQLQEFDLALIAYYGAPNTPPASA